MPRGHVRRFDMKIMALFICALTMIGCSSSYKLVKPGMTQEQWYEDYYECSVKADQAIGFDPGYRTALGNVAASDAEHQRWFNSCCEAKGYRKVSAEGRFAVY